MKKFIFLMLLTNSIFGSEFKSISDLNILKKEVSNGVSLVEFYEDWCHNCPVLAKNLLASDLNGVKVFKVKLADSPEIHSEYQIMAVPSIIVFKNGKIVEKSLGVISKSEIESMIKNYK
jgi:thioredoxin 1